jgi:hypothetical protein
MALVVRRSMQQMSMDLIDWAPYEANKIGAKGYGDSWKNAKEGNTIPT